MGTKPSMSCPRSTTTPLSISRSTRPRSSVPTGYVSPILSQGSSWACFKPREIRLFSASTFRISTSTSSPFFTTSDGCCTRFVHDMSEMWIRPSMPGSISTKAPNEVRLRTLPRRRVPTGYFCGSAIQGSSSVCFMPREIFSSASSTLRTTASIVSPMETILEGCRTLGLELDERAVVGDRDHLALHARADGILRRHVLPRIGLQLLQAEADALALPVDVEHLDLDLLADLHQLGRMRDPAIAHVGDVEQAVHAAQVDERTEVGDVLDDAFADLTDLQLLHQDVALRLALRLEQHTARHHDVAASLVELDDLEIEALAQQLVDVGDAAQRDLTAGKERVHAHQVHDDAALDLLHQRARHGLVPLVGLADALPHPHEVGFLLREDHRAFLVLEVLEEDLDLVPLLERLRIFELVDRHRAFRLEPDVENDGGVGHTQHFGFDDLALLDVGERALVQLRHLGDFVRRVFLVEIGSDAEVRVRRGRFVGLGLGRVVRIYQHSGYTGSVVCLVACPERRPGAKGTAKPTQGAVRAPALRRERPAARVTDRWYRAGRRPPPPAAGPPGGWNRRGPAPPGPAPPARARPGRCASPAGPTG